MARTKQVGKKDKGAQSPPSPKKQTEGDTVLLDPPGREVELTTETTGPATTEEPRRRLSSSSSTESRMYRTCDTCKRGNQLAVNDLHDECIACLHFSHLEAMLQCRACQALGYRDRLERARRFAWWKATGNLLSARAMRDLLKVQQVVPRGLEKARLEPYFLASAPPVEEVVGARAPRRAPTCTVSVPPERAALAAQEMPQTARRSLILGGPARYQASSGSKEGSSAQAPITLSSPDPEEEPEYEEELEEGSEGEVFEEPQSQFQLLAEELKAQREQARKDKEEFLSMFSALRTSLTKEAPLPRQATATPLSVPHYRDPSPLTNLPSTSAAQRVSSWQGFRIPQAPALDRSPSPSVAGESTISDSLLANISIEETPYSPRQLAEGQSPFDWDTDGAKYVPKEDLPAEIRERITALDSIARDIATINQYPQEAKEVTKQPSKILGAPAAGSRVSEVTIPLPQDIRDIVDNARKHRTQKTSLLPPTVRKGYRVPRQDWAYLGAVRRPDRVLESYCRTKKSAKGVHQLQDQHAATLAAAHQEAAQATAHTLRPISLAYQATATIHDLAQQAKLLTEEPRVDSLPVIADLLDKVSTLAQYSLTAAADAADCTARLNAEALRKLRAVWLDNSRLPDEVKDAVKSAPIEAGSAPVERGVEFTTPIAGEVLKKQHDLACARARAEKLLTKKASALQKPAQKRKGASEQSPSSWKKPRQGAPQQRQGGGQRQQPQQRRGGGRGGRGGRNNQGRGGSQAGQKSQQGKNTQPGSSGKSP